jgi:hypothetical protein
MISSPLMDEDYDRLVPDYDVYRNRKVTGEAGQGAITLVTGDTR